MTRAEELARVHFTLSAEEAWTGAAGETLWASRIDTDLYKIDNIPFFVRRLAVGDIVRTDTVGGELPEFRENVQWGGHLTIRVIALPDGPLGGDKQRVIDALKPFGIEGEGLSGYRLVALDIPPGAALQPIKALLRSGRQDGSWEFEEGRINDEWRAL